MERCLARHIKASRSRPCCKNDNCFAGQKDYDAVRKTAGYFRFDTPCRAENSWGLAMDWRALGEVYRKEGKTAEAAEARSREILRAIGAE